MHLGHFLDAEFPPRNAASRELILDLRGFSSLFPVPLAPLFPSSFIAVPVVSVEAPSSFEVTTGSFCCFDNLLSVSFFKLSAFEEFDTGVAEEPDVQEEPGGPGRTEEIEELDTQIAGKRRLIILT